jgi:hypothetical protein
VNSPEVITKQPENFLSKLFASSTKKTPENMPNVKKQDATEDSFKSFFKP